jgi:hypothetical protein
MTRLASVEQRVDIVLGWVMEVVIEILNRVPDLRKGWSARPWDGPERLKGQSLLLVVVLETRDVLLSNLELVVPVILQPRARVGEMMPEILVCVAHFVPEVEL